jgi:hypothetical protein
MLSSPVPSDCLPLPQLFAHAIRYGTPPTSVYSIPVPTFLFSPSVVDPDPIWSQIELNISSVADPGCLSRIPDPKTASKERDENKFVVMPFFVAKNFI